VKKQRKRKILLVLASPFAFLATGVAWANWSVEHATEDKIFTDARKVPVRQVGVVLGTTPRVHGYRNPFFENRLDAAAALYRAGKVRCLLVSGDHGTRYYNEVEAMRDGLVKRGVPNAKIGLDHAGFRTLDSMVRAKKVFGIDSAVIVTDDFHLPRSLYLAGYNGIDAVGLSSVPVPSSINPRPANREIGARALMMWDLLVGRQPKYLGPHEKLPG
jgi:SanA protein